MRPPVLKWPGPVGCALHHGAELPKTSLDRLHWRLLQDRTHVTDLPVLQRWLRPGKRRLDGWALPSEGQRQRVAIARAVVGAPWESRP